MYRLWIHMADTEWSSHQNGRIMENLANEYAKEHPQRPLFIEIYEHGGWFHLYFFGDEAPEGYLIGTANDAAPLSQKSKDIMEKYKNSKTEYLGTIRR